MIDSLKLKTSSGVISRPISNKLLKYVKDAIIEPLTTIINQTLKNVGIFPNLLKISKVIPIFKKNDKTLFSNYRPISLPSFKKNIRKIILEQITIYFEFLIVTIFYIIINRDFKKKSLT